MWSVEGSNVRKGSLKEVEFLALKNWLDGRRNRRGG